jgi:hypothetical protein
MGALAKLLTDLNVAPAPQLTVLPAAPAPARRHEVCAPAVVGGRGEALASLAEWDGDPLAAMTAQLLAYCDCQWGAPSGESALAQASHQERALVLAKARFLERVEQLRRERGLTQQAAVDFVRLQEGGRFAPLAPAQLCVGNLSRWKAALPKTRGGQVDTRELAALARQYATGPRGRAGDPDWWHLALQLYLSLGEQKKGHVYRRASELYRETHPLRREGAIPTERQWDYYLERYVPEAVAALERRGLSEWREQWLGFVHRRWDLYEVNEVWFGDGHTCDWAIQAEAEDGSLVAIRPTLCAWRDLRSGYLAGHRLCPGAQNQLVILTSLIDGLIASDWRPPRMVVTDWGQDYRSLGLFEPRTLLGRRYAIGLTLGIEHRKSRPYNGREKPVERDFRELCDGLARRMPAYLGNSPEARTQEVEKVCLQPERLPTLAESEGELARWLSEYHQRRSAARVTTDRRSPAEAWANQPSRRRLSREEVMTALIWPHENAPTVSRANTIQVTHPWVKRDGAARRDRQYQAPELAPFAGRQVVAGIVPWTDELVVCYHPERGTPLCVARRPLAARPFDEEQELLAEISRRNNWFLGWARRQAEELKGEIADPALREKFEAELGLKPACPALRLSAAKQAALAAPGAPAALPPPPSPRAAPVAPALTAALDAVVYGEEAPPTARPARPAAAFAALDALDRD